MTACVGCGASRQQGDQFCRNCGTRVQPLGPSLEKTTPTSNSPAMEPQVWVPQTDWESAVAFGDALRAGWTPPPIRSQIATWPGESVIAETPGDLWQYTGADVSYRSGGFVALGSPLLLVASLAGSLAYNAHQKNKAQQQAAAQWRLMNQGTLIFTSQRIAIAGSMGWLDMPYANIRATGQDGDGIVLFFDGSPRLKLRMWNPLTHFVLLRYLAYGDVPPPALPMG